MDAVRAQLDALMGRDRNVPLQDKAKMRDQRHFSDSDVCKWFLMGLCPHDLFPNTKVDLGPCPNSHDESLKQDWDSYENKQRYPYEEEWIRHLERLIADLERR